MNRWNPIPRILILALCFALLPAGLAWSASQDDPRVGFVDIKKAVADTNEFKRIKSEFDRKFQKEQKMIADREEAVKKLFDELNKQGFVLSPELKKQKEARFIQEKKAWSVMCRTRMKSSPGWSRK